MARQTTISVYIPVFTLHGKLRVTSFPKLENDVVYKMVDWNS